MWDKIPEQKFRTWFYILWMLLLCWQAFSLDLLDDEAYYWMYSKDLAWGYFDHPPMIALWIKCGVFFGHSEFTVRLFILFFHFAGLLLLEKIIKPVSFKSYALVLMNVPLLHIISGFALPDAPLMFFSLLFIFIFDKFQRKQEWANTFWLGISAALLLYSKYHGLLIILFCLLSQPGLFLNYKTYIAGLIGIGIFFPHLYWQYMNDFPSLRYHLFERTTRVPWYQSLGDYTGSQLLFCGPFMGWFLLYRLFYLRPKESIHRALKFTGVGFFLFFLFSSFKSYVEANWTLPILFSLVLAGVHYLETSGRWIRLFRIGALASLCVVIGFRILLMTDNPRWHALFRYQFYQSRKTAEVYKKAAKGNTVLFINSYQNASKYSFYTGKKNRCINNEYYRRNQYDIWKYDSVPQNVMVAGDHFTEGGTDFITTPREGKARIRFYNDFFAQQGLYLKIPFRINVRKSDPIKIPLDTYSGSFHFGQVICFIRKADHPNEYYHLKGIYRKAGHYFEISHSLPAGKYRLSLLLPTSIESLNTINSGVSQLNIK